MHARGSGKRGGSRSLAGPLVLLTCSFPLDWEAEGMGPYYN